MPNFASWNHLGAAACFFKDSQEGSYEEDSIAREQVAKMMGMADNITRILTK
jgi:hypothetical protein